MAKVLSKPSQPPPFDPPTTALPPLPVSKTRKSLPVPSGSGPGSPSGNGNSSGAGFGQQRRLASATTPSKLRIPSSRTIPVPVPSPKSAPASQQQQQPQPQSQHQAASSPSVPTLRTLRSPSPALSGDRTVRRSVSISSFPQPPKSAIGNRLGSLRGRPSLGAASIALSPTGTSSEAASPSILASPADDRGSRRVSQNSPVTSTPTTPASMVRSKKQLLLRKPQSSSALHAAYSTAPTLLNGSGDSLSVSAAKGSEMARAQRASGSPSQSRSSSAQGSYSTQATTFEDVDETSRNENDAAEGNEVMSEADSQESRGNVLVSVRVRPNESGSSESDGEWMVDGRRSLVAFRGREGGDYYYDNVFTAHDSNAKVFHASAKRLVRRVMEGYHGTVFAYGMTGTGKTYSMQGTGPNPGVIPQAVADIFSFIRETPRREFLLRVSYLEIYNEEIRDLLAVSQASIGFGGAPLEKIKLREDSKRGVYATPVREEIVQSPMQLLRVIAQGDKARHTGVTQYNTHSSRSHAIVKIVVESRERAENSDVEDKRAALGPGGVRVSTLSLIDLAGSEKAADTKERRTEGAHINKSLLTLGTVIARLSGNKDKNGNAMDKDGKHLPYRDSKLTRLLQPALSGNALISILCTIQIGSVGSAVLANNHTVETLNTLKFAARARNNIVSHAKKAEEALGDGVDPASRGLLEHYRIEIKKLRSQLDGQAQVQAEREEKQLEKEAEDRHRDQLLEMQLARTALKERIEHLNRLILSSQSQGVNHGSWSALGMHSRLGSPYSPTEQGTRSVRSSASMSTIHRTPSGASTMTISLRNPGLTVNNLENSPLEEEDPLTSFADGNASLTSQNRALQASLAEKNRYISNLERRLLQARRTSDKQRQSNGFSMAAVQERDAEIADLRSKLEERDRALADLNAEVVRLRSMENTPTSPASRSPFRGGAAAAAMAAVHHRHRPSPSYESTRSGGATSNTSASAASALSPMEILSKKSPLDILAEGGPAAAAGGPIPLLTGESKLQQQSALLPAPMIITAASSANSPFASSTTTSRSHHRASLAGKRKSIDEMSRMLDEMIQEKVERGELVGDNNSAAAIAAAAAAAAAGNSATGQQRRNNSLDTPATTSTTRGLNLTLRPASRNSLLPSPRTRQASGSSSVGGFSVNGGAGAASIAASTTGGAGAAGGGSGSSSTGPLSAVPTMAALAGRLRSESTHSTARRGRSPSAGPMGGRQEFGLGLNVVEENGPAVGVV